MGRGVRNAAQTLPRGPGGADLDLRRRRALGQTAEVMGAGTCDGAARFAVRQPARLERAGQPGPAHVGQQRVGGHLRLQLRTHQGHQPERTLPGIVPVRVVQQHQPAVGQVLVAVDDGGLQRVRVRSQPLRCLGLLDLDLRPQPAAAQSVDRGTEGRRSRTARLPVRLPRPLRVIHPASAVRQSSLSRSHAGRLRGTGASCRARHPVPAVGVAVVGPAAPGPRPGGAVRDLPP